MNDAVGCKDAVERSGFVAMVGSNKSRFVICHHHGEVWGKREERHFHKDTSYFYLVMETSTADPVYFPTRSRLKICVLKQKFSVQNA